MKITFYILLSLISTAVFCTDYTSIQSGNWDSPITWTNGVVPSLNKENIITISDGTIVVATNTVFSKATLIIVETNSELIFNTVDVSIDASETAKDFTLDVQEGGTLTINGDFTAAKDAALNINGNAAINGNVNLGKSAAITVDGVLDITGNLTAGPGSVLLGEGPVTVGGEVNPESLRNDSQLPIGLLYFEVISTSTSITLNWKTSYELNNDYFEILYSVDGILWSVVCTLNGSSYSMIPLDYSIVLNKNPGYYLLKQTDYNGDITRYTSYIKYIEATIPTSYIVYTITGSFIGKVYANNLNKLSSGIYYLKTTYTTITYIVQ